MTNAVGRYDPERVARFWSWFEAHSTAVASLLGDSPSGDLAREISRRVSLLHEGLGWEVGPGTETTYQFVISPNGNRERLRISRAIVQQAPALAGWEFFCAKPPKSWNLELDVVEGRRIVHVNCRSWQYRLTGFSDNTFFDVDLYPEPLEDLNDGTYRRVGVLLVEGEIGEELFIERIDRVIVHSEGAGSALTDLTPIVYLHQHLLDITGNAPTGS